MNDIESRSTTYKRFLSSLLLNNRVGVFLIKIRISLVKSRIITALVRLCTEKISYLLFYNGKKTSLNDYFIYFKNRN